MEYVRGGIRAATAGQSTAGGCARPSRGRPDRPEAPPVGGRPRRAGAWRCAPRRASGLVLRGRWPGGGVRGGRGFHLPRLGARRRVGGALGAPEPPRVLPPGAPTPAAAPPTVAAPPTTAAPAPPPDQRPARPYAV